MPQIGQDYAAALKGKIVLDAGNPNPRRDGAIAEAAVAKGAGIATQEHLPGARIVRAFNQLNNKVFLSGAHRAGEKIAVPLGGDDKEALAVASRLVTEAGFEPGHRRFARGEQVVRLERADLPEDTDGARITRGAETSRAVAPLRGIGP
jgi:hypothetical protein